MIACIMLGFPLFSNVDTERIGFFFSPMSTIVSITHYANCCDETLQEEL